VRAARPTVALAIVLLAPELVAASGLKKYPLLDEAHLDLPHGRYRFRGGLAADQEQIPAMPTAARTT